MTMNGPDTEWSAVLPIVITLSGPEKRLLEAIAITQQFGGLFQFDTDSDTPDPSEELERLEELDLIESETIGETFTGSGRSRNDGHVVYRINDRGQLWLEHCKLHDTPNTASGDLAIPDHAGSPPEPPRLAVATTAGTPEEEGN
jgi:hypothetical protein